MIEVFRIVFATIVAGITFLGIWAVLTFILHYPELGKWEGLILWVVLFNSSLHSLGHADPED